ncbi:MAG: DUF86 domain-containing protein [Nitrospirae bacterium]|nr:DUF86 domain-containing protein [Nitrospirota bacterium]
MTALERDLVRRKFRVILENLAALKTVRDGGLDTYRADLLRRKATERLLQEAIEAALDINAHILSQYGPGLPEDYFESFVLLGNSGVLPVDLAKRLAPAAGLRNRLVHEYDALDDAIVFESIGTALRLFPEYVKAVEIFLDMRGRSGP